jgi:hypothetical protein
MSKGIPVELQPVTTKFFEQLHVLKAVSQGQHVLGRAFAAFAQNRLYTTAPLRPSRPLREARVSL